MSIFHKKTKLGWPIAIPILFWLACMAMSVGKMIQTGKKIQVIDCLEIINSNTFSTYISMIICMAHQYFSVSNTKKQEESGLSRKWIGYSILTTVIYGIIAVVNACRYNLITTTIMTVASVVYIILFFKFMRAR